MFINATSFAHSFFQNTISRYFNCFCLKACIIQISIQTDDVGKSIGTIKPRNFFTDGDVCICVGVNTFFDEANPLTTFSRQKGQKLFAATFDFHP